MEFLKSPLLVTGVYRERVAEVLRESKVAFSGFFDESGVFGVVRLGERTELNNIRTMWAQNLLRFTSSLDGVRTTGDGFLHVYHERMQWPIGDRIEPVHTIAPGNVRFVDPFDSYSTRVRESGWLIGEHEARRCQTRYNLTIEGLEEILIAAEAGEKPPFFDRTAYIKVEPGFVNRAVRVIRFGTLDAVVIDVQSRQLVGKRVEDMLSPGRWGVRRSGHSSSVSIST